MNCMVDTYSDFTIQESMFFSNKKYASLLHASYGEITINVVPIYLDYEKQTDAYAKCNNVLSLILLDL